MPVIPEIAVRHAEMIDWRRDIHAHPETAYEEHRTAALIAAKLVEWGIEVHRGIGGTGVVGVLHTGRAGRRIGLRAEMDALPIAEANTFAHASRHAGKFHGCGHDGHVAMLLGAARYLAARAGDVAGAVAFIFQPAEEGGGGAQRMVDDGLFERFPCDEVYTLHNRPVMSAGHVAVHPGAVMAAEDGFRAEIRGRGGHAATPQQCADPIVAAAQLVSAWQTLVSRRTDPLDAAVISVTQMHAGETFNVIPDNAWLGGTIRTLRPETRDRLAGQMAEVAEGLARASGVEVAFVCRRGYPATINHPAAAAVVTAAAKRVAGNDQVHDDLPPSMGADDFAYMLEKRRGAYFWLGQAVESAEGGNPGLHSPHYDFNDHILPIGASIFSTIVQMEM